MTPLVLRIIRVALFLLIFYPMHRAMIAFLSKKLRKSFSIYDMEVLAPSIIFSYLLSMIIFLPVKLWLI